MIDVERARRETPGCAHVVHLNNAGSAPLAVLEAVIGHIELEGRIGGYEAHAKNEEAIERFYGAAAELIGARPDEIAVLPERDPRLGHGVLRVPVRTAATAS